MNRADAIELDERNLKSELFHAKQALKHNQETAYKSFECNSKVNILLKVIETAYQTNETDVQKKASEKLSKLLDEI